MKLSTSEKRYFIIKIRTKTEGDRSPFSSISTFLPFWYDQCLPADNFVTIVYTIRLHNIFYGCTCPIKFIADIPEAVPFFHNISSKYFIFFFFRFSFCFFCGFSFFFLLLSCCLFFCLLSQLLLLFCSLCCKYHLCLCFF